MCSVPENKCEGNGQPIYTYDSFRDSFTSFILKSEFQFRERSIEHKALTNWTKSKPCSCEYLSWTKFYVSYKTKTICLCSECIF